MKIMRPANRHTANIYYRTVVTADNQPTAKLNETPTPSEYV